tara:strand:- start:1900 stop:2163 length:264 start_codon:yes stop_codon:yes gene_type:complete
VGSPETANKETPPDVVVVDGLAEVTVVADATVEEVTVVADATVESVAMIKPALVWVGSACVEIGAAPPEQPSTRRHSAVMDIFRSHG